jgi:hypothetical protein
MAKLIAAAKKHSAKCRLIVVMGIGAGVIGFFGFDMHNTWWYSWVLPNTTLNHEQGWELGAIVWTAFFLIYYWIKLPAKKMMHLKVAGPVVGASLVLCWLAFEIILKRLWGGNPIFHIAVVMIIGGSLLVLDLWLGMKKTAWMADFPMLVGFGILSLFLLSHASDTGVNKQELGVLVPGAIAFELIVSNILFFVVEWGFLDSPLAASTDTVLAFPATPVQSSSERVSL